jgi:subtilase family serine protease
MSSVIVRSGLSSKVPSGWAPADLQSAYNLPSATKGKGQIVAIVEAYDNPRVAKDLAKYRATFKLSKAIFTKYNQEGQTSNYPAGDESWGIQIDLDVEMVSASCPNCTIYLVEANSSAWSDLEAAQAEAVTLGAHIVSNSFNGGGADESFWDTRGVTYVASSADAGGGLEEPASFEHVVAVGGTTLSRGGGGSRGWTESIWIQNGGCVSGQKPAWQRDKYAKFCHGRLGNDVSAIANNVAEYDSYGLGGWTIVTGTQVGAPFLAGVFGLAGNAENQNGGRTFWLTSHHQYLYQVEKNGKYVKYSEGGGWGSPNGTGAF